MNDQDVQGIIDIWQKKVADGRAVQYTLNTDGWQNHIVPGLEEFMRHISDVRNIENEQQLMARKEAIQIFTKFQEFLYSFIDEANSSAIELEKNI